MKCTLKDITGASYSFNAVAKTITISGVDLVLDKSNILAIINAQTAQVIQKIDTPALALASVVGNVLTLSGDTTGMLNTDAIDIWLEIPNATKVIDENGNNITQQIQNIEETLLTLVNTIGFLASTRGILNDLRVTLLGGTTTVTGTITANIGTGTLATLGNQSSQGGFNSAPLVPSAQNLVAITQIYNGIIFS